MSVFKFSKKQKNCYLKILIIAFSKILCNPRNSLSILSWVRLIPSKTRKVFLILNSLVRSNQQRNHPSQQARYYNHPHKKIRKFQFQKSWTKLNIRTLLLSQNGERSGLGDHWSDNGFKSKVDGPNYVIYQTCLFRKPKLLCESRWSFKYEVNISKLEGRTKWLSRLDYWF